MVGREGQGQRDREKERLTYFELMFVMMSHICMRNIPTHMKILA